LCPCDEKKKKKISSPKKTSIGVPNNKRKDVVGQAMLKHIKGDGEKKLGLGGPADIRGSDTAATIAVGKTGFSKNNIMGTEPWPENT